MKNKKLKKLSLTNLIVGYIIMSLFLFLIVLNLGKFDSGEEVVVVINEPADTNYTALFDGVTEDDVANLREIHLVDVDPVNVDSEDREIVYVDRDFVRDSDIGLDHSRNLIINRDLDLVGRTKIIDNANIYEENLNTYREVLNSNNLHSGINDSVHVSDDSLSINNRNDSRLRVDKDVDAGFLDRRLANLNDNKENLTEENEYGLDKNDPNLSNLSLDEGKDRNELGDIDDFSSKNSGNGSLDSNKGALYAYNYPSQGVGAGIGSAGVGAAAGFAGIGAGLGEAVLEGKSVPALGGIGSYVPVVPTAPAGPDGDGDELPDAMESVFKTNPKSNDTDKDGVSDSDEIRGLSNPLMASSKPLHWPS